MLFNSFAFLVFLPVVFLLYWGLFAKRRRAQNLLVIAASYLFYGWWDPRYLILLFASSFIDYWLGIYIDDQQDPRKRKGALLVSLVFNLGILGFFKYFNFFIDSFADLLRTFGMHPNPWSLQVILPVGVSFYTFQSLSYTIEAYRRNFKPERDLIAYLAFVSFFPHMVAGPIMRAVDLLPQFQRDRTFDLAKARDGIRQMLWGFVKKIVIADQCAPLVNDIFGRDPATTPGITLCFGAFLFAFQIYGDFSGYSDIAIGCARFFGIDLMRNFNYPYFSRSIGEFWKRWHISLSTWFRDFLYIPLGGSRVTRPRHFFNLFVTFLVSGFWHGANWTFVTWGGLHGMYYLPEVAWSPAPRAPHAALKEIPRIIGVFCLVCIAWVFFRAATIRAAFNYLVAIFRNIAVHPSALLDHIATRAFIAIAALIVIEWRSRRNIHPLQVLPRSMPLRWSLYLVLCLLVAAHIDVRMPSEFIYFQF